MKKAEENPMNSEYTHQILDMLQVIFGYVKKVVENDLIYYDNADLKRMFHISDSTLHRLRKQGVIEYIKIGGKYFYRKSFIDSAFIQ